MTSFNLFTNTNYLRGGGKVRGARGEMVKCEVPVRGKLWLVGG